MRYYIGVDPGAVHCGVAYWSVDDQELWTCHWAVEMKPEECVDYIRTIVTSEDPPETVFVEGFWLKPGLDAMRQAGSQMETTEVIGAIRHLCRWNRVPFDKVANGQQAIITRLKAAGYIWVSKGFGDHAKDAECVVVRGMSLKVKQLKAASKR